MIRWSVLTYVCEIGMLCLQVIQYERLIITSLAAAHTTIIKLMQLVGWKVADSFITLEWCHVLGYAWMNTSFPWCLIYWPYLKMPWNVCFSWLGMIHLVFVDGVGRVIGIFLFICRLGQIICILLLKLRGGDIYSNTNRSIYTYVPLILIQMWPGVIIFAFFQCNMKNIVSLKMSTKFKYINLKGWLFHIRGRGGGMFFHYQDFLV